MRRGEFTDTDGLAYQHGRGIVANRAFAIGACNVDGPPRKLDPFQQGGNALQSRLNPSHGDGLGCHTQAASMGLDVRRQLKHDSFGRTERKDALAGSSQAWRSGAKKRKASGQCPMPCAGADAGGVRACQCHQPLQRGINNNTAASPSVF